MEKSGVLIDEWGLIYEPAKKFTGCSSIIVYFSKNSRKFATSPSPALGCYWLYKKLTANRTLALFWELWRSLTAMKARPGLQWLVKKHDFSWTPCISIKNLDSIQNYQLILPPPPYPNPEVYKDSKSLEKPIHCYQNILSPSFILSLSLCSLWDFRFFLFLLTNIYRSI